MSSQGAVVLHRYQGTYDKCDRYSIMVDGQVKCKDLSEEDARVKAKKLSGENGYIDKTEKRSVIAGKTVIEQSADNVGAFAPRLSDDEDYVDGTKGVDKEFLDKLPKFPSRLEKEDAEMKSGAKEKTYGKFKDETKLEKKSKKTQKKD